VSTEESQSEGGQSGDLSDPAEYSAEQSIGNKRKLNNLSGSEYSGEQSEKKK
jgi:hypothetical protein